MLDAWLSGYDRRASFHCHLSWHLAMFELHRGHHARALEIFQRDILAAANARSAMSDGTALLWRLRLDGATDLPWRSLADLAERVSRPAFIFGEATPRRLRAVATTPRLRAMEAARPSGQEPIAARCVRLCRVRSLAAGDHAGVSPI